MNFVRKTATVLLCITLLFSIALFTACENSIKKEEAQNTVKSFFECVGNDDYEGVLALYHPNKATTAEAVGILLKRAEQNNGLDFGSGITEIKFNGYSSKVSDGDGSFEIEGKAKAGEKKFKFELRLARNADGYGICDFDFYV